MLDSRREILLVVLLLRAGLWPESLSVLALIHHISAFTHMYDGVWWSRRLHHVFSIVRIQPL